MNKKGILISIGIIILLIVGFGIYYMDFPHKNLPENSQENIYLFNKTKNEGINDISVYNMGDVVNLGTTTLNFVKYIPNEQKYIIAEPSEENNLKSNLVLVNEDGAKQTVASVVTNMLPKVEIINDYLFYKESDSSEYIATNLNEEKLNQKIKLKDAFKIITSYGEYVYYLNKEGDLYSYNFYTKETIEIIKGCKTENVFDDNIVLTLNDGSLYYYDMKKNILTKDEYKISDNVVNEVSSDSKHDDCDTNIESEHIKFDGEIPPITIIKSFNGERLIYEVPKPNHSGVKDLYLKVKNQKPILIAQNINNVKIFGNDCFVNTLITAENKKFTGEVKYINLDKPTESRVISNVYCDVTKMEKTQDGTYYMSYSDVVDDTPEMSANRGGLFKFKPSDTQVTKITNDVIDFAIEGNNIVYAKVNSLTDWNGKYNIYVNDKEVANNVEFVAIRGTVPIFEGNDGYLYIVKDGQVQMLDIKVKDYSLILNK
ncbi:MAG: hypothetical protein ACRDCW_06510 [Sarcina sp.]